MSTTTTRGRRAAVSGLALGGQERLRARRGSPREAARSPAAAPEMRELSEGAGVMLRSAQGMQPRAYEGYRKPCGEREDRAARGRLAARAFAHHLCSREAQHLPPARRQQLQRLFSQLMEAATGR